MVEIREAPVEVGLAADVVQRLDEGCTGQAIDVGACVRAGAGEGGHGAGDGELGVEIRAQGFHRCPTTLLGGFVDRPKQPVAGDRPPLVRIFDGPQRGYLRLACHGHPCSAGESPTAARYETMESAMSAEVTVRRRSESAVAKSIDGSETIRAFILDTASDMTLRT